MSRTVPRELNEDTRDMARAIRKTTDYERTRHRRREVEMLLAHLKRILHLSRLRRRGTFRLLTSSCSLQPLKIFEGW